jgi:hypothetical protein
MLNLYRRHQPPCPYTTGRYRSCKCPIWVQGSLRALDLRSWSAATNLVRDWKRRARSVIVKKPDIPTIAEAVDRFFVDLAAQRLFRETIRKYENLLRSVSFSPKNRVTFFWRACGIVFAAISCRRTSPLASSGPCGKRCSMRAYMLAL